MPSADYDLAIVGAGAAGLIAASFARQLGARVALIEKERIGGDCTWTGCVPSKSLIKVATVAQTMRAAGHFGLAPTSRPIELARVRAYLRQTIEHIYAPTSPLALQGDGLDVHLGAARFLDPHTLLTAERRLRARRILICTGALPRLPALDGLAQTSYFTYRNIFENDRLPESLIVIGAGPVGCEIAQAYRRLGSQVTLVAPRLLPRAEPEAADRLKRVFSAEGIRHLTVRARAVRTEGPRIIVSADQVDAEGDMLLIAAGRAPQLADLALEAAGVRCGEQGIQVDACLRTTARHVYAAGDVIGGAQFSHLAGWQAFQAVRNALLPASKRALPTAIPEVTFTVPEIAHVGLTEAAARHRFGNDILVEALDLAQVDRAVSEHDTVGLVKLIADGRGQLLGATVMGERAGEVLGEISLALSAELRLRDLAACIHPYPTYNSAVQLLATQMAVKQALSGFGGRLIRMLSRWSLTR
jgi:pyruvate/2-oxoglutarate dehydrogenase complex dihydrolipoamide dehydrogenase (E3) component